MHSHPERASQLNHSAVASRFSAIVLISRIEKRDDYASVLWSKQFQCKSRTLPSCACFTFSHIEILFSPPFAIWTSCCRIFSIFGRLVTVWPVARWRKRELLHLIGNNSEQLCVGQCKVTQIETVNRFNIGWMKRYWFRFLSGPLSDACRRFTTSSLPRFRQIIIFSQAIVLAVEFCVCDLHDQCFGRRFSSLLLPLFCDESEKRVMLIQLFVRRATLEYT